MGSIEPKQINQMLANSIETFCKWILPEGKKIGSEWCSGDVYGSSGISCRINIGSNAGVWADFATGETGDLLSLIMKAKDISFPDALKEAKMFLGIQDFQREPIHSATEKKIFVQPRINKEVPPSQELYTWFSKVRGISKKTVDAYGVREMITNDGLTAVFPYYGHDGKQLVHIKYRNIQDKKKMWSSKDTQKILFGWQVMDPKDNAIIITEGELDAMAFYEAGIPAVSVPCGGGSGGKQDWIKNEWDRLNEFQSIFIAMDTDEEGIRARDEIRSRLGPWRCFIIDTSPYKDANDALRAGADIREMIKSAKTKDPEELCQANSYWDKAVEYAKNIQLNQGDNLPWDNTFGKIGIRLGELIIWSGYNGHGKSQILGHTVVKSISDGNSWCVASMEFKPAKFLNRLYKQICGNWDWMRHKKGILNFLDEKLYFVDIQGNASVEKLFDVFEYAYRRYGVKHFLIDSMAKCGIAEDDYKGQKELADRFSNFARDKDVTVHLVVHAKKTRSEMDMPDKFDVKGSGGIVDMADTAFIVWRNKPKEEGIQNGKDFSGKPDCILYCCKQREGDWEGKINLYFDKNSLQYGVEESFNPVQYCINEASND